MCLPECVSLSPPPPPDYYPLWLMEHSSQRLAGEDYIWTTHRYPRAHSRIAEPALISKPSARAKPTYTHIHVRLKPLCVYTLPDSTYAQSGLTVKANMCSYTVYNCHGNTHTHTHTPSTKGGGASATVAPYHQHSTSLVCHTAAVWTTHTHT